MKSSDSTNSLTGLTEQVHIEIGDSSCFICLDEINEIHEPLVDSSLLRTCGCRFKVHPSCWNTWMIGKSDYDCPICRKESLKKGKRPIPIPPTPEWALQETNICFKRPFIIFLAVFCLVGGSIMVYKILS